MAVGLGSSLQAFAQEWILSLQEREKEREREKWYFTDHLSGKSRSSKLDLLYKFFLGSRSPRPRVELAGGVVGELTRINLGVEAGSIGLGRQGVGYGGRIAFNNFVSGLTGLRTLNIVPNFSARLVESRFGSAELGFSDTNSFVSDSDRIAGGFRLMGENLADSAFYVDYERRRARLLRSSDGLNLNVTQFESWLVNVRAEIYLFPALAFTGSAVLDDKMVESHHVSPTHSLHEFSFGGHLDLSMFRISYEYIERDYLPIGSSQVENRNQEMVHSLGVSIVF